MESGKPIIGDDLGNLTKAGYDASAIDEAKKVYDNEISENAESMKDISFSQFLYDQAVIFYVVNMQLQKK